MNQPATPKGKLRLPRRIRLFKMDAGEWAQGNQEKVDTYVEHLVYTFQPTKVTPNINLEITIKRSTLREIRAIINTLKPRKASGLDLITARILQELPEKALKCSTYLFNATLHLNHIPTQWNTAILCYLNKERPLKTPSQIVPYPYLRQLSNSMRNCCYDG